MYSYIPSYKCICMAPFIHEEFLEKHKVMCKGPRYGDTRGLETWFCEICDKKLLGQIEIRDHPHTLLEVTNYNPRRQDPKIQKPKIQKPKIQKPKIQEQIPNKKRKDLSRKELEM